MVNPDRNKLLEDTLEYQTVPFLVRVEERDMFVNAEEGRVKGINIEGNPTGMRKTPKGWKICRVVIARVRPDYPYSIEKEWPDNVDKHFQAVEPLEWPVKKEGLIWSSWRVKKVNRDEYPDAQEVAERAIEKMKHAYENRDKVQSLEGV